jgi:hypothetical protein
MMKLLSGKIVRNILFELCLGVFCQGRICLVSRWRLSLTARRFNELPSVSALSAAGSGLA